MTASSRFPHHSGPHGPDGLMLLGLLLTPVAAGTGALAAWRFGVDAGWTSTFFIAGGFLSHWQVWCAFAISAEAGAYILRRGATKPEPVARVLARSEPIG
ncbi:MAG TPA: hypothetical protein VK708_13000 [Bryobacteraceae bacterium]|jgi:hypothetical protein|nr:hypothetical protein [Bryobacteraceae bacterium]